LIRHNGGHGNGPETLPPRNITGGIQCSISYGFKLTDGEIVLGLRQKPTGCESETDSDGAQTGNEQNATFPNVRDWSSLLPLLPASHVDFSSHVSVNEDSYGSVPTGLSSAYTVYSSLPNFQQKLSHMVLLVAIKEHKKR
jgi:hypothetical protein